MPENLPTSSRGIPAAAYTPEGAWVTDANGDPYQLFAVPVPNDQYETFLQQAGQVMLDWWRGRQQAAVTEKQEAA